MAPTTRPPRSSERRPTRPKERTSSSGDEAPKDKTERKRTPADKKLGANIANMYQGLGAVAIGLGMQRQDAGIVQAGTQTIEMSEGISEAWLDLCDANPKVRQALIRMTEVSSVGVLVSMHVTIALPVLVSRGVVPPQFAAFAASENGNGGDTDSGN